MLQIRQNRPLTPSLSSLTQGKSLPAKPPLAIPPPFARGYPHRTNFYIPRPRVDQRVASLKAIIEPPLFELAERLIANLPQRAMTFLHIDRALMILKNELTEKEFRGRFAPPLTLQFSSSRADRKEVDLILDFILRAVFDPTVVNQVYRATQGCFDSHLKTKD